MFDIRSTEIADVKLITPQRKFADARGFFAETYRKFEFGAAGIVTDFVQENHSLSILPGTVRGIHFQSRPRAQSKLIYVVQGRIFDVVVDIRRSSPTFRKSAVTELSAANMQQLWVPVGMAHGLCTLEPNTVVVYKTSEYYSADHDRGILWNDPELGISWPVACEGAILSDKDRTHPKLKDSPFLFD